MGAMNLAGLLANLIGVILLFRYGMPYRIGTDGMVFVIAEDKDAEAGKVDAFYSRLGKLGLALIVVGTGLQAIVTVMSMPFLSWSVGPL